MSENIWYAAHPEGKHVAMANTEHLMLSFNQTSASLPLKSAGDVSISNKVRSTQDCFASLFNWMKIWSGHGVISICVCGERWRRGSLHSVFDHFCVPVLMFVCICVQISEKREVLCWLWRSMVDLSGRRKGQSPTVITLEFYTCVCAQGKSNKKCSVHREEMITKSFMWQWHIQMRSLSFLLSGKHVFLFFLSLSFIVLSFAVWSPAIFCNHKGQSSNTPKAN